jgi:Uma2 family endonuclease
LKAIVPQTSCARVGTMSSAPVSRRLTPEEYLAFERRAEFKSEYRAGLIHAMSGASREDNLIAGNLFGELRERFRDRPCEAYVSDMRVWVSRANAYFYPDVVAVCGEPQFQDETFDSLRNPSVIVEVSSKSTMRYDRGKKFDDYRTIPSLRQYIIVAQDEVRIECFTRVEDAWTIRVFTNLDDRLSLESIDCEIPLASVYAKVTIPTTSDESQSP